MTTEDAKSYLSKREVPRLFESLMTGLMYHRPTDHIQYLIDCLEKVKSQGPDNITWSSFVDIRRTKTPLPPIPPENGKRPRSRPGSRPGSRTKTPSKIEEPKSIDERKGSPLPPISQNTPDKTTSAAPAAKTCAPSVPVVFFMGGPGSGKLTQIKNVVDKNPGWVHLSMGDLLRKKISEKGTSDQMWTMVNSLMSKGEMAPEEVTVDLIVSNLAAHKDAKGFIIEGYPRDCNQVEEYDKVIGRVDMVVMLDAEEHTCTERLLKRGFETDNMEDNLRAIARRVAAFKQNTLPTCKHYDDLGMVHIVDAERDIEEVCKDVLKLFANLVSGAWKKEYVPTPVHPSLKPELRSPGTPEKKSSSDDTPTKTIDVSNVVLGVPPPPEIVNKDEGRKDSVVPKCPILFLAGGPGSGKGIQGKMITDRYKGVVHLSIGDILRSSVLDKGSAEEKWGAIGTLVEKGEMAPMKETVELLVEHLNKHKDATAFVIEGFPRNAEQVEEFNKYIGGLNFVMLLDCEEYYLQQRLVARSRETNRIDDNLTAIANRISYYKNNTLPVLKHYEDQGKLTVFNGDRDVHEIFYDITRVLDMAFFGDKKKDEKLEKGDNNLNKGDNNLEKGDNESKKGDNELKKGDNDIEKGDNKDNDKEIHNAASKIQAGFRGHKTRKEVKSKKQAKDENSPKDDNQNKQEVSEEVVAPQKASTTGGDEGNPQHTAKLDEAAQQAQGSAG